MNVSGIGNSLNSASALNTDFSGASNAVFAQSLARAMQGAQLTQSAYSASEQTNDILMAILLYLLMSEGQSGSAFDFGSELYGESGSMLDIQNYDFSAAQSSLPTDLSALGVDLPMANSSQFAPIVSAAMSRLGDPYSQAKAGSGDYTDCSYLSRWCYQSIGVEIPRTAAEQARYCDSNDYTISKEELRPGDLVFYSLHENGRYKNITHVGIYAGNGMMVDASSIEGEVVYREVFSGATMYGRPR